MQPCRTVDPELFPTMTDTIIDSMALVRLWECIVAMRTTTARAAAHVLGGRA